APIEFFMNECDRTNSPVLGPRYQHSKTLRQLRRTRLRKGKLHDHRRTVTDCSQLSCNIWRSGLQHLSCDWRWNREDQSIEFFYVTVASQLPLSVPERNLADFAILVER